MKSTVRFLCFAGIMSLGWAGITWAQVNNKGCMNYNNICATPYTCLQVSIGLCPDGSSPYNHITQLELIKGVCLPETGSNCVMTTWDCTTNKYYCLNPQTCTCTPAQLNCTSTWTAQGC